MLTSPDLSPSRSDTATRHRGMRNYCAGQAAEDIVARHYTELGCRLLARRFRSPAGEIDLIFRKGPEYVFVEVKAGRTFDAALEKISQNQVARIYSAARIFLGQRSEGEFAETRFDAGLVNGAGEVEVMEGALLPY